MQIRGNQIRVKEIKNIHLNNSIPIYNPLETYNEGDIVFYKGNIYTVKNGEIVNSGNDENDYSNAPDNNFNQWQLKTKISDRDGDTYISLDNNDNDIDIIELKSPQSQIVFSDYTLDANIHSGLTGFRIENGYFKIYGNASKLSFRWGDGQNEIFVDNDTFTLRIKGYRRIEFGWGISAQDYNVVARFYFGNYFEIYSNYVSLKQLRVNDFIQGKPNENWYHVYRRSGDLNLQAGILTINGYPNGGVGNINIVGDKYYTAKFINIGREKFDERKDYYKDINIIGNTQTSGILRNITEINSSQYIVENKDYILFLNNNASIILPPTSHNGRELIIITNGYTYTLHKMELKGRAFGIQNNGDNTATIKSITNRGGVNFINNFFIGDKILIENYENPENNGYFTILDIWQDNNNNNIQYIKIDNFNAITYAWISNQYVSIEFAPFISKQISEYTNSQNIKLIMINGNWYDNNLNLLF